MAKIQISKKRNYLSRLLPITGIVLVIFFLFFLPPRLTKISSVECETQYGDCPKELESRTRNLESRSLGAVKKEIKKIIPDFYYISDFSTQFKIPSTLKLNVLVKKPVYALNEKDTQNFTLVDADGRILAITQSSSLPTVITTYRLKNVGESISEDELIALKIISGVSSMYQVNRGEIQGLSLVVELPTGFKVIFPLRGFDRDILLGSLRVIVNEIEANDLRYKEIDLRFRNPVLR